MYGTRTEGAYSSAQKVWPTHDVVAPALTGEVLDHTAHLETTNPDTDGDGVRDDVTIDMSSGEQVMVITRGDGVVRVALAGSNLGDLTSHPPGDLDADGHDEVLFLARPAGSGADRIFVLPGATAPGSYQADDVAIEVPTYFVWSAGNQVDGPGDDLVVWDQNTADPNTSVVSGDQIMAAGPGGSADFSATTTLAGGYPMGVFDLGDSRPAVVTALPLVAGQLELSLWRDGVAPPTRFVSPASLPFNQQPSSVAMVGTSEGLVLSAGEVDRGGSLAFYWDVDDPCRELPVIGCCEPPLQGRPPGSEPAQPADPLNGAAPYTG